MKNMLPLLIVIMLLQTGLIACSSHSGNIRATDQSMIDKIKIGTTTKDQVQRLLGDTTNIQRHGSHETWTYRYRETNIGAKAFIPFANLAGESAVDVKISMLVVRFNAQGIVEEVKSFTHGNE